MISPRDLEEERESVCDMRNSIRKACPPTESTSHRPLNKTGASRMNLQASLRSSILLSIFSMARWGPDLLDRILKHVCDVHGSKMRGIVLSGGSKQNMGTGEVSRGQRVRGGGRTTPGCNGRYIGPDAYSGSGSAAADQQSASATSTFRCFLLPANLQW
ncbi:hypothetical protein AUEXF2481DRAFT_483302 [Aureobasidium subglaciale EXF-2481]|uniref:Uncharacterized protein n=1 Tax=Aureobasidium subglaciale (strain EXF-2481) TaxID=1043005 RepID=A0A074YQE0_AURSE|nr:uncharacterized protein AUEXF2481DRAFT_483302 [Aureobasidium subglaciale EXF-2481]KEQ98389.1 hypothetical protein AUEXF2481DRAFT_483302 [Aureobasidium subglaciale EXF-2481]